MNEYAAKENQRILSRDFVIMCLAMFFTRMIFHMQNAVFPLYVTGILGLPKTIAGTLNSTASIAAIITRPFIGRMVDRGRTKPLFIFGAAVYTISVLGSGIITSIPLLFIFRFTYGIGQSSQGTTGSSAATQLIPGSRMREGVGYFGLTASLSQAFGPMLAIALVTAFGYRNQFIASTGLLLGSCLMGMMVHMPTPAKAVTLKTSNDNTYESDEDDQPGKWWHNVIEKTAAVHSLVMLLTDMALVTISTFLLIRADEIGVEKIGLFYTVQAVSVTAIRLFGARLSNEKRERSVFIIGLLGMTGALIAIFFATKLWHFVTIAALYGLCTGNYYVTMQTMMITNAPEHRRGMANSTYFISYDIGVAVGAPMWGFLADTIGTRYIYPLAAMLPMISMIIFITKIPKKTTLPSR